MNLPGDHVECGCVIMCKRSIFKDTFDYIKIRFTTQIKLLHIISIQVDLEEYIVQKKKKEEEKEKFQTRNEKKILKLRQISV